MIDIKKITVGKNLLSIDFLRFIAAFAVYYYHQHIGLLISKQTNIGWFEYTDIIGEKYAVPLFFLISGFCIHYSSLKSLKNENAIDLKKFYLNRFWRIYPPYLIALFTSIALLKILPFSTPISVNDFFIHLGLLQGLVKTSFNTINLVLWTITIELCLYIIYPIFYHLKRKYTLNIALYVVAGVSILSIIFCQLKENDLSLPVQYLFTNIWFGWCFGAWLCEKYVLEQHFFQTKKWKILSIITIFAFVLSFFLSWDNDILVKYNIYIIVWSPLLIICILNENFFARYNKLLTIPLAIGASSYSLYLLHQPLIVFKNFVIYYYFSNQTIISICLVLGVFAIPAVCYLNYQLFELPFMSFRKNAKQ